METCFDAHDVETQAEERRRLASAALLFAQVAEHLERGHSLPQAIAARCTVAVSLLRDDHLRRTIEILLTQKE
jgi:hypothetical protein